MKRLLIAAALVLFACHAAGVSDAGERSKISVKLTEPSRPCIVTCSLINGGIYVSSYSGREVIVETVTSGGTAIDDLIREKRGSRYSYRFDFDFDEDEDPEDEDKEEARKGLKKIPVSSSAFEVQEDDNEVLVEVDSWSRAVDVYIQVPVRTSVNLSCINGGDIVVENVTGEVETENINGNITLSGISGSVIAYVQNGDLTAELKSVTRDKPMSFASFNGDVDVTLPAGVKTTVKVSTHTGDAYSDFDIEAVERPTEIIEDNKDAEDGKYRVRIEEAFYGNINGGGPEFDFSTFNGDIYIRKAR